jgi:hypothetical protein
MQHIRSGLELREACVRQACLKTSGIRLDLLAPWITTAGHCPPPLTIAVDVLNQWRLPLRRTSSQGF